MEKRTKLLSSIALILTVSSIVILTNTSNNTDDISRQDLSNTRTNLQKLNASVNEYQDVSGKTIIKGAIPKTLKNVEEEIKTINTGLDKDLKGLEAQKA